jgi:hypothetical protein
MTMARILPALTLVVLLTIACSKGGSPTTPDLRNGNPAPSGNHLDTPLQLATDTSNLRTDFRGNQVPKWAPNEVLVVLQGLVSPAQAVSALQSYPLQLKKTIRLHWGTVYELLITDGTDVRGMVKRLKTDPLVRIAQPNFVYTFLEAPYYPNDPMWESSDDGDSPRDNAYEQWGPSMIGASLVWNESKGSSDVIVAVIDTGVRYDHEDLTANIWINEDEIKDNGIDDDSNGYIDDWWGWDTMDNDNDPWDDGSYASYHGTACSGVVAAIQDNFRGVSGVAPGIKVMALKTDLTGSGAFDSTVTEALQYAHDNGADICSMSFGTWEPSEVMEATCIDIWDNGDGTILMAAAGNEDDTNIRYPSAYDSVLTVGATIPWSDGLEPIDEARISWEIGYYWGSCYGEQLVVMGYGDKYTTTHGAHYDSYWDGGYNGFFGGTSCATPMSAGVMALIKSFFPEENGQWCWDRIKDTADDLDVPGFDIQTGYGRCNALRAIYGSDRWTSQEDSNGFVPLVLPSAEIYDTIHDVEGNPYYDIEDLYKVTTDQDGTLLINLDIFTLGENLDLAVYSDAEMTELVDSATGPNHAGSSFEELFVNATAGQEFFIKVYSPVVGNSTTYGLKVHQLTNEIWVSGGSLAPAFVHRQGEKIPFLKLTFEAGSAATLDELIINKHGTLPNANWINARLYEDTNNNKQFDPGDQLVSEVYPQARNRVRMPGLGIEWNYHQPMILFFAADFAQTPVDSTVSFSLETYKDVITAEGIVAGYGQFPIQSDELLVGTDNDPPVWTTTIGAQFAEGSYKSARVGWNEATDVLTPPVEYNIYYTTILPFDIDTATKLPSVDASSGSSTDYQYNIPNLPAGIDHHIVVRAVDQAGNEDDNLVIVTCTPSEGGDPHAPVVLNSIPLTYPQDLDLSGSLLVVAEGYYGLTVFDRSDPVYPSQISQWTGDSVYAVKADGHYAYCGGYNYFNVVDLSYPESPTLADSADFWDGYAVGKLGNWAYVASGYYGSILPIDVSDPNSIKPKNEVTLNGYGYDLVLNSGALYAASFYSGIEAFDRTNPGAPTNENTFGDYYTIGLALSSDTLYSVSYYSKALTSYDISADPYYPPELDSDSGGPGSYGSSVVLVGDYAYVARSDFGIVTFDVSDPGHIQYLGQLALYGVDELATDGELIYAVGTDDSYQSWLWVII